LEKNGKIDLFRSLYEKIKLNSESESITNDINITNDISFLLEAFKPYLFNKNFVPETTTVANHISILKSQLLLIEKDTQIYNETTYLLTKNTQNTSNSRSVSPVQVLGLAIIAQKDKILALKDQIEDLKISIAQATKPTQKQSLLDLKQSEQSKLIPKKLLLQKLQSFTKFNPNTKVSEAPITPEFISKRFAELRNWLLKALEDPTSLKDNQYFVRAIEGASDESVDSIMFKKGSESLWLSLSKNKLQITITHIIKQDNTGRGTSNSYIFNCSSANESNNEYNFFTSPGPYPSDYNDYNSISQNFRLPDERMYFSRLNSLFTKFDIDISKGEENSKKTINTNLNLLTKNTENNKMKELKSSSELEEKFNRFISLTKLIKEGKLDSSFIKDLSTKTYQSYCLTSTQDDHNEHLVLSCKKPYLVIWHFFDTSKISFHYTMTNKPTPTRINYNFDLNTNEFTKTVDDNFLERKKQDFLKMKNRINRENTLNNEELPPPKKQMCTKEQFLEVFKDWIEEFGIVI
jgi:hypothetical protein